MDRVVSPFLPEAIPKVVASGWMHSVCNVETLGHYCTPLRGKEQREWLKGCMAGCWLFLQAQVTCTYWGLGGDLGEPVAFFTPAAVLEGSPCSGRPGLQRCEGIPGSSAPVWQNAALFFQSSLRSGSSRSTADCLAHVESRSTCFMCIDSLTVPYSCFS